MGNITRRQTQTGKHQEADTDPTTDTPQSQVAVCRGTLTHLVLLRTVLVLLRVHQAPTVVTVVALTLLFLTPCEKARQGCTSCSYMGAAAGQPPALPATHRSKETTVLGTPSPDGWKPSLEASSSSPSESLLSALRKSQPPCGTHNQTRVS